MAADSSYLPSRELRFIYLLIGECCELGGDPLVWRQHLLKQLNRHLGVVGSVYIDASIDNRVGGVGARVDMAVSVNQYTSSESELLFRCVKQMRLEDNPIGVRVLEQSRVQGPVAATCNELLTKDEWERCPFLTEYFAPLGWYGMLVALMPKSPRSFQLLNFSRVVGDRSFSRRNSRTLSLLAQELSVISELRLAGSNIDSVQTLPSRERQVLLALSEGDDEKQTALKLNISRNTVHEYVRRLYQRYQVNSRAQLLVAAARQLHAIQLQNADASQSARKLWLFRRDS